GQRCGTEAGQVPGLVPIGDPDRVGSPAGPGRGAGVGHGGTQIAIEARNEADGAEPIGPGHDELSYGSITAGVTSFVGFEVEIDGAALNQSGGATHRDRIVRGC